jgi:hypothetical protein
MPHHYFTRFILNNTNYLFNSRSKSVTRSDSCRPTEQQRADRPVADRLQAMRRADRSTSPCRPLADRSVGGRPTVHGSPFHAADAPGHARSEHLLFFGATRQTLLVKLHSFLSSSFFLLPSCSLPCSTGSKNTQQKTHCFSQIPGDLATKTSPFCCY